MRYFDRICEEKNPKNRYIRIFWTLLDFDPPGGGGHELSKSVKIWIKGNFGMRNSRSKMQISKLSFLKSSKSGGFNRQSHLRLRNTENI
jgi:hypothetical protein